MSPHDPTTTEIALWAAYAVVAGLAIGLAIRWVIA